MTRMQTQHAVTFTYDFWMKQTEVTQNEWSALMRTLRFTNLRSSLAT